MTSGGFYREQKSYPHAHPLVRQFFEIAHRQGKSLQRIADVAGLSRASLHYWGVRGHPSIGNFEAAANVLGYEIVLQKMR